MLLKKRAKSTQNTKKSFLLKHLVNHMCDMYNYGFTKSKFNLPTPAV